jgi:hypothetical protein
MFQEFIKEQNEYDLFLHPKNNNNLVFLTNFIKLELEFFNFGKMEFEINEDLSFITNTYPSGMASNQVVICRVTKQFNLLSEKYKGIRLCRQSLEELRQSIIKKQKYNYERRRQLYNSHFLRNERAGICCDEDENKIIKMINLCIENNIEIKGINLVKFRNLRRAIKSGCHLGGIDNKQFEEIKI